MNPFRNLCVRAALAAIVLSGCGVPHGQPTKDSEVLAPNEVLEFGTLYAENCAGCHGSEGHGGAAIALANPVYLAVADDAVIRKVIANGVRGTAMPAFAQSAGGMLTDAQIDVITKGIRSHWSKQGILDGANAPPYAPKSSGDAHRGEAAYKTYCESCHGASRRRRRKAAQLRMILFSRWSAIRDCARSSSPAGLNWEHRTGAEMYPESPCPIRKSPT